MPESVNLHSAPPRQREEFWPGNDSGYLMADVAVVHPDLSMKGGAEDVCLHAIEALQTDHRVTLLTLRRPDISALNEYFRTAVDADRLSIRVARSGAALNGRSANSLVKLQAALLGRAARRHCDEFDLAVSTKNEFDLGEPSLQYVHSPQFVRGDPGLDSDDPVQRAYDGVCRALAGVSAASLDGDRIRLLANSDWTAGVVKQTYGVDATTVYPPVDTDRFPERPWADREPGFLSVGRIGPSKNLLENADVLERVRERGHDVQFRVVGPTTDGEYCERVRARAAATEWMHFVGEVGYDRLAEMITANRYGLHGRPYEHFGIVVAEYVAGGAIPFVPDSGGQREIVGGAPELCYEGADQAVEKIDRVLSAPDLQRRLRADLEDACEAFTTERFQDRIRDLAGDALR